MKLTTNGRSGYSMEFESQAEARAFGRRIKGAAAKDQITPDEIARRSTLHTTTVRARLGLGRTNCPTEPIAPWTFVALCRAVNLEPGTIANTLEVMLPPEVVERADEVIADRRARQQASRTSLPQTPTQPEPTPVPAAQPATSTNAPGAQLSMAQLVPQLPTQTLIDELVRRGFIVITE